MNFDLRRILALLLVVVTLVLTGCNLPAPPTGENGGETGSGETGGDQTGGDQTGGDQTGGETGGDQTGGDQTGDNDSSITINGERIPAYSGEGYVAVNGNIPFFTEDEITSEGYYTYTELDSLGRCGVAIGCIGPETLPKTDRESISHITPSGWKYNGVSNNNTYPELIGQNTVYNRSHLLANQLVEEDVDKRNLITGTRYMNQIVMKSFENMVADYVKETDGHVMYRVTPIFEGSNLVASGVLMEAWSVEDDGEDVCFCVYLYNVEPGVEINYLTGENWLAGTSGGNSGSVGGGDGESTDLTELTALPEDNKAYHLTLTSAGVRYYFAGAIGSKKTLTTTTEQSASVAIYFESASSEGSYYIYFLSDGTKQYITMTANKTTAFSTVTAKGSATTWTVNLTAKQIVNGTNTNRALAFYAEASDIRTYATSQSNVWVWIAE